MMEKMTFLVVPLINDVFHTSYPADVEIVQLRNEYQRVDGEIITDSRLLIGNKIYLRSGSNTPDFLEVDVVFPDGKCHLYRVPTIKVENYTKDKIFEKSLLMLLPFYPMRRKTPCSSYGDIRRVHRIYASN